MLIKQKFEIQFVLTISACGTVIPWNKVESIKNNLEPKTSYKILYFNNTKGLNSSKILFKQVFLMYQMQDSLFSCLPVLKNVCFV